MSETFVAAAIINECCTRSECADEGEYAVKTYTCGDCGAGPFIVRLTKAHSRPARVECPDCKNHHSVMTKAERA